MPITLDGTTGIDTPGINAGNIVGQVCFFAMATAPTGFLTCDGSAVSRTTYADLFAAIGTLYGAGNGTTTFNLPDLRGEFIRGADLGRGVDSGRALGSAQSSQNLAHNHTGTADSAGAHIHSLRQVQSGSGGSLRGVSVISNGQSVIASDSGQVESSGAHTHTVTIANSGDTEARPRNVALLPCIKF